MGEVAQFRRLRAERLWQEEAKDACRKFYAQHTGYGRKSLGG